MGRWEQFQGSVLHEQFSTIIYFCNFFFFFLRVRIISCILNNSDRQSALFHPTPLVWSAMGIAAWLHTGVSSCAGVTVKLVSSSCPLPSCQCTTVRSGHKLHRSFIAIFSLEDMKYSLSRVSIVFSLTACPSSVCLLLISFVYTVEMYLGLVVQVFLNYMCRLKLFLTKTDSAKCF